MKGSRTRQTPLDTSDVHRAQVRGFGAELAEHFQVSEPAELVAGDRGHRAGVGRST